MPDLPRRSIDDLMLRYELEPSLSDIYVEGDFDRDVLTACVDEQGCSARIVYTVDSVEVPFEILSKYGLTEGNKQRVIALSRELGERVDSKCKFLVDRDLDHWFEDLATVPGLVWTRYCSLELYFFNDELLKRFLIASSRSRISDWQLFIKSFCLVLVFMYAARLADKELDLKVSWVAPDKDLRLVGGLLEFDQESYISKILNKSQQMKQKERFTAAVNSWFAKCLVEDHRLAIRGHDFVALLAFVVKNGKGIPALGTEEAVERALVLLSTRELEVFEDLGGI